MIRRLLVLTLILLLGVAGGAWAAFVLQWVKKSTTVQPLTTQLNSLGSNAFSAASAAIDNTLGSTNTDGYTSCRIEAKVTYTGGVAPAANSAIAVWFIKSTDGTNYDDVSGANIATGPPNLTIPATTGSSASATTRQSLDTWCPFGLFKVQVQNVSGLAFTASGHTLTILFATVQGT